MRTVDSGMGNSFLLMGLSSWRMVILWILYGIIEFGARSFAEPPYKISKELFVLCVFIRNRFYLSAVKLHCIVCRNSFEHPLLDT